MRGATGTMSRAGVGAPMGQGVKAAILATLALVLAGCGSQRLSGPPVYASQPPVYRGGQVASAEPIDEALPAPGPSAPITSSPLPPAPGTTAAPGPTVGPGGAPLDPVPAVPPVANLGTPAASAPSAPSATRVSATGRWTAKEASGGSCSVSLSSAPSLDLYKANTSGCANKDLQSVNAWEFRDGEVYLYARGGVVARLRDSGGSFSGALAKSGAPLTLSK